MHAYWSRSAVIRQAHQVVGTLRGRCRSFTAHSGPQPPTSGHMMLSFSHSVATPGGQSQIQLGTRLQGVSGRTTRPHRAFGFSPLPEETLQRSAARTAPSAVHRPLACRAPAGGVTAAASPQQLAGALTGSLNGSLTRSLSAAAGGLHPRHRIPQGRSRTLQCQTPQRGLSLRRRSNAAAASSSTEPRKPAPGTAAQLLAPHQPVLLQEVLGFFTGMRLGTFIDGTLGAGGHASATAALHQVSPVPERAVQIRVEGKSPKALKERHRQSRSCPGMVPPASVCHQATPLLATRALNPKSYGTRRDPAILVNR